MNFAGDLRRFYLTPVDSSTPYEALGRMKLPENLHIQQEYHRFHPGEMTRVYNLLPCIVIIIYVHRIVSRRCMYDHEYSRLSCSPMTDTDSLFGGKSAFPKSSTIIVGLKCKKKYRGYRQDNPFLQYMLKI